MTGTSWQVVGEIFQQVFDLPEDERSEHLRRLCLRQDGSTNDGLRREVENLLRAHDLAEQFTHEGFEVSVGELSASTLDWAPDRRIGPYTLIREIGQGGMGTVFLAARADDEFDRLVAIKMVGAKGGPDSYERFLAERQVHANLEHPGIARLYGGGTSDTGVPYIVMEYVEGGQPISTFCDRSELPAHGRIELFRQVCSAVAYAHRNLVVHRDLKPNNILVTPEGVLKLLDFGISKLLTREGTDWDPTNDGPGPLTPSYASPEQILGEAITTASDVFSLGVLLFRLLTGRLPFAGSLGERLRALKEDARLPSLAHCAGLDSQGLGSQEYGSQEYDSQEPAAAAFLQLDKSRRQDLEAIVSKAMHLRAAERYGSVEQLDDDLRRWQTGLPVSARLPTLGYRFSRLLRRNWLAASFAASVVVTLLASSIILAAQNSQIVEERDRAQGEAAKSDRMLELLLGILEGSDPAKTDGKDVSVRDVMLAAEPRIGQELAQQPRVQAALFESLGRVFYSLGSYDDAQRVLSQAREIWQQTTWPESAEGVTTLDLLARIEIFQGDFDRAAERLEQGRQLRVAELGPGSVQEARSLARISYVRLLQYQNEAAETAARRALEIFELHGSEGFEEEHIEAQHNYGEMLHRRGGRELAEPQFKQALDDSRKLLGRDHPSTLAVLGRLAELKAEDPDQLDVAEEYTRERIDSLRRVYKGKDHPDIAVALSMLAGILARKGDLEQTEEVFQQSIDMQRLLAGEESPFLAITTGNLGWFHLFRRHDPVTAEPILRHALAMAEKFYTPTVNLVSFPLIGVGRCRTLRGAPLEGETFLRRALAIREATFEADSLRVARAQLFLGENLAAQGRCQEAQSLLLRSQAAFDQGGDSDDLSRAAEVRGLFEETCGAASTSDTTATRSAQGGPAETRAATKAGDDDADSD